MASKIISFKKITKKFGDFTAINELDFFVEEKDIITILGPSGSGKSTLLKMINALETFDSGELIVNNVRLPATEKQILQLRKSIGMVFQQFNLFNHLSVIENVTIAPIKSKGINKINAISIAKKFLDRVGLIQYLNKYPAHLSGGQQQRVAIARALSMEPKIILFDEPTSALDPEMVKEVLDVIRDFSESNITMVIVTHEIGFAREIANKMCFCDNGKILVNDSNKNFFKNDNKTLKEFLSKIIY